MSVPKKNKNKKVDEVSKEPKSTDLSELINDLPGKSELSATPSETPSQLTKNTDGDKPETEKGGDASSKFIPLSQRTAMPDVLYYKTSKKHGGVLNGVLFDIKARELITDKYLMYQLVQQGLEDILTENLDECDPK